MEKWLRSNTFVKVMSVGLAILLYIAVNDSPLGLRSSDQETATVIRNVALEAELNEAQFTIVEMPQTVSLTLRGNSFLLNRIAAGNYRAFVDLTNLRAGVHRNVPVQVDGLFEGIEYVADPANVRVVLEEKQQKEMDVEVDIVGQPKEGYTPGTAKVTPEVVFVRASESRLKNVAFVKAVVNISDVTKDIKQSVNVKAYNQAGEVMDDIEIEPEEVEVEVPITSPSKEIPIQALITEPPPDGYAVGQVTLEKDVVTVFGEQEVIDQLDVYTGPEIDLSGITKDRTFEREIALIKGVDRVEPGSMEVEVEIVPSVRKEMKAVPLKVSGLSKGWKADIVSKDDRTLDVTVEGAPSRIDNLKKREIQLYVDVSELDSGTHDVEVEWRAPAHIKLETKKSVKVELKK